MLINMKFILPITGLLFLCMILAPQSSGSSGPPPKADLALYYTASLNGNLDGCDCIKIRRAGLVKRASFE